MVHLEPAPSQAHLPSSLNRSNCRQPSTQLPVIFPIPHSYRICPWETLGDNHHCNGTRAKVELVAEFNSGKGTPPRSQLTGRLARYPITMLITLTQALIPILRSLQPIICWTRPLYQIYFKIFPKTFRNWSSTSGLHLGWRRFDAASSWQSWVFLDVPMVRKLYIWSVVPRAILCRLNVFLILYFGFY